MSFNTNIISNLVANGMTEFLEGGNPIFNTANREYEGAFTQQIYMTGGSINIKVPGYPSVQNGLSVTPTAIQDFVLPYTITQNDIYSVTRQVDLFEQRFNIKDTQKALTKNQKEAIVDNYAYPAYLAISKALELTAAFRMKTTAYLCPIDSVSKLGTLNTYSSISAITAMMDYLEFSPESRVMMMNLTDGKLVADSLQNMFNPTINGKITRTARIGGREDANLAGLDIFQSAQFSTHIAGPLAAQSGMTISAVGANGSTITITNVPSTTSQLVNAGDMISIPSVQLINPITKVNIPFNLVVTAAQNANGDGAGNVTVTLSYPLMASGEHANVNSLPAVNAPVQFFPNHNINFAYVKSGLSAVPLQMGDIYGAYNSDTRGDNKVPVKAALQGSVTAFNNVFRISMMCGILPFAPYIIAIPSIAPSNIVI